LKQEFNGLNACVSHFHGLPRRLFDCCFKLKDVSVEQVSLPELLAGCTCAFVKSGTATLETALRGVPMVIVYKTSGLTYTIAKHVIRVPYIGLPNIVAGERIVPECIQHDVTGPCLADAMRPLLAGGEAYRHAKIALSRLEVQLGTKKPSWEMSERIAEYCVAAKK
jgi:lipid-A-disaccharide synthase